jgi:hypothetical protein
MQPVTLTKPSTPCEKSFSSGMAFMGVIKQQQVEAPTSVVYVDRKLPLLGAQPNHNANSAVPSYQVRS